MISIEEVIADADLQAPQAFAILRSTGQFVAGGFNSATVSIQAFGPVQRATSKQVDMLPEGDRVGAIMAFWWTRQIFTTSGKAPVQSTYGETPSGAIPGYTYTLSVTPPSGIELFKNGLYVPFGTGFQLAGAEITLAQETVTGDVLYALWPITAYVGTNAADILVYNSEQYRVLDVKHFAGSGYWRALATRMSGK